MKKLKYILLITFIPLFKACFHDPNKLNSISGELLTLNIDIEDTSTDTMNLSDIATNIEYIPLQTSNNSLLGYFNDFIPTSDNYFIKYKGKILKYSSDGIFEKDLIKVGRGPEEAHAGSFTLNPKNQIIYILDDYSGKLKLYDFDGRFIQSISQSFNNSDHRTTSINYFQSRLFISSAQRPLTKYIYSLYDFATDSIIVVYKNYNLYDNLHIEQKNFFTLTTDYNYQICDSSILFKEFYCDTIFKLNSNLKIVPQFIINLKNHKLTWDNFRDNTMFYLSATFPKEYWVQSFAESDAFLFLVLRSYYQPEVFVIYDKNLGTIKKYRNKIYESPSSQIYLRNDLDKLVSFPIMNRIGNIIYYDNCLYTIIEGKSFAESYNNKSERIKRSTKYLRDMEKIFSNVDEFSNPIIIKLHLKE